MQAPLLETRYSRLFQYRHSLPHAASTQCLRIHTGVLYSSSSKTKEGVSLEKCTWYMVSGTWCIFLPLTCQLPPQTTNTHNTKCTQSRFFVSYGSRPFKRKKREGEGRTGLGIGADWACVGGGRVEIKESEVISPLGDNVSVGRLWLK